MPKSRALSLLLLSILLVACAPRERPETPTPFSVTPLVARITTAAPIPIGLANLAANPDFFVGATLQLSGAFRRLPRQVCAGETFRSPATWGLEADGYLASAAGMDRQLRALLAEGQSLTVEGRWLRFSGPVGCGPQAEEQDIWYLSVDRVLEPHPLVQLGSATVAAAPTAAQPTAVAALVPSATVETPIVESPTAAPVPETATLGPEPAQTLTAATTTISATVTISGTAVVTQTPALIPTATAGATPDPAASPTATLSPGATRSPLASTATATVSGTAVSGGATERGSLDFEDLVIDTLPQGSSHSWTLDLAANSAITLTVAPATAANITLSVLAPDGSTLVNAQNQAPAGEVETIRDLQITNPGSYRLLVGTTPAAATDYALMAMDSDSYSFDLRGTLRTNNLRSDTLAADHDHFWFFSATNGDALSFTVTPQDSGDPYVELYDPGGARILTIDNTGEGDAESLTDYTLLASGMYGIRVAEFDFRVMSYQIILSSP